MSELQQALADAAEEVLSTMFFAMLDAAPDAVERDSGTCVEIRFRGRWTGLLTLYSSPAASAEMAANFLGLEGPGEPPIREQESVVEELANMICGAVLSRLQSAEVFELLPPELCDGARPEAAAGPGTQVAQQAYSVGNGVLCLRFRLDELA